MKSLITPSSGIPTPSTIDSHSLGKLETFSIIKINNQLPEFKESSLDFELCLLVVFL